mmetsp:Transcript_22604/g.34297  ORF Transcript_22604/g.34297 Transcript_22604/m.34297 type:complete len:100 (+) Transcript_22604:36-335(+)
MIEYFHQACWRNLYPHGIRKSHREKKSGIFLSQEKAVCAEGKVSKVIMKNLRKNSFSKELAHIHQHISRENQDFIVSALAIFVITERKSSTVSRYRLLD